MIGMSRNPESVVQGQLDAYNARDMEAFMAFWADDAQYFEHPATLLASGAAEIRDRHISRFREPNLNGRLVQRMIVGNKVVDQEVVTRIFPDGLGQIEVIAMYEVEAGKITRAWFTFGPPILLDR